MGINKYATTRLLPFTNSLLPGYFHKIIHGDFFGAKSLNGAILDMNGIRVGIFTTHLHAEYDSQNDEYLAHRVAQVFLAEMFFHSIHDQIDNHYLSCNYILIVYFVKVLFEMSVYLISLRLLKLS